MKNSLIKLSISSVVAVVGVTVFLVGMPVPIVERALSQVSEQEELAEAERLSQQAVELNQQGKFAEAIPLVEKALAIRKKVLGDNHLDVAYSLNILALLYSWYGRYEEAEPLFQESLAITKEKLGDNHLDVAYSLNNLALFYRLQGRYTEVESLFQESLAITKEKLGDNHPNVATSLNNLAGLYRDQGNYREALPLYQRSLVIYEKALGTDHPLVATSLNNLAGLYRDQGDYREALRLYQRSLAIYEKALGVNNPNTASSLSNLATLYFTQGNYKEALRLYQRSLAIREKALGTDHPDVASSLNNLAELYQDQGNYAEALRLYQRSLAIREKALGTDHLDVASSLNNLAELYQDQGNYAEALRLYQRSLAIRKKVLGTDNLSVATSLNNLAELYRVQQRYSEAEPLYQKSLDIFKQHLGDDHPDVATSLHNLALLYDSQGRYTKAEPLYLKSLEILEQKLGENDPNVAKILKNLSILYQKQGDYTKAVRFYKRYLDIVDSAKSSVPSYLLNLGNKFAARSKQKTGYLEVTSLNQENSKVKKHQLKKKQSYQTIQKNSRSVDLAQNLVAPSAIDYIRPMLEHEENHLREVLIFGDESQKLDFQKSLNLNTNIAVSLHLQSAPDNIEALRLSFTTILRRKGRILDILTNSIQALRQSNDPESKRLLDEFERNRTEHSNIIFMKEEERKSSETQNKQLEEIYARGRQLEDQYEGTLLNLLGTQLVVLSACDTGIGDISAGEGIYGLRRAFVIAGSESQMISLWKVEDNATKDLMVAYYQGLKAGKGRRDALLEIQRDWLKQGEYQHPYYWASFIFSGDGTPMEF